MNDYEIGVHRDGTGTRNDKWHDQSRVL